MSKRLDLIASVTKVKYFALIENTFNLLILKYLIHIYKFSYLSLHLPFPSLRFLPPHLPTPPQSHLATRQ